MKKSWKRIVCGILSLGLASTLVAEQVLRSSASDEVLQTTTGATSSVAFKDVTGSIDTSALRESQLNDSVLKNTDETPTYETRTVMVTLSGDSIAEASDTTVNAYLNTFTGQYTLSQIRKEQNAFLRNLKQAGISYKEEERYETLLNAVAIEVDTKYVSQIKQMAGVESVVITTSYAEPQTVTTSSTQEVFNVTSVYQTGIYDSTAFTQVEADGEVSHVDYGEGTVVAILDTGLDYTHEAFQRQPDNPAWSKDTVTAKLNSPNFNLRAEERSSGLETKDVYVSSKVPFAYDYADNDADVYPSYSNHGTHVAGIIGGYTTEEVGYTDKDGNDIYNEFRGVVPDSQLVICKVFTDDLEDPELGGAQAEDIIAALEDCVMLEVDVINMSLGTSCGFSTTNDGDDEGEMLNAVYQAIQDEGISLVCAASNDYSAGYGGVFGTNLKQNPDSSTVGSPSTFASALSVASISGQESPYMIGNAGTDSESFVFFEESRDENSNPFDFVDQMLGSEKNSDGSYKVTEGTFDYVVIPGTGDMGHYTTVIRKQLQANPNTIALVKRGDSTFQEKVQMAKRMGAKAIIVYNNVAGLIRMNLGEIEESMRIPAVSIDMDAGNALINATRDDNGNLPALAIGKITISRDTSAGPFMSEFSSWGPTHDLKLKPEITAHGGEITSTVPGGYGEQSGTSMASPNMAGVMAIIRNYVKSLTGSEDEALQENIAKLVMVDTNNDDILDSVDSVKLNRLANQLIMSTATTVRDQAGRPYSPRKQGAGLGSLDNVVNNTTAFLWVDNADSDYRPKLEIGDDPQKTGVISKEKLTFNVTNFGSSDLEFATDHLFFTETVAADGLAIAEQAYMLDDVAAEWYLGDSNTALGANAKITVPAGETVTVSVQLALSPEELEYMGEKNFPNGMYLEGFLKLKSASEGQCDLSIPFLGFHGDWEGASMLDYTAYEVAADEADPSLEDAEKKQASVWATQPYSIYYNEKYILPMGSFVYLVDENDDPVYTDEKYNAISRYNNYYGDDNTENYLTTTGIKAVYAGLLRNARLVTYSLTNVETGEAVFVDKEINRVGKAYAGGGQAVPGNVEVELYPEELGLLSNGQYRMDFTFYMNDPDDYTVFADDENLPDDANPNNMRGYYSFTFTVDYDAPVLQDARIRYKTVKDSSGKESQTIYLDMDVYDNHYAQAIMLCYPKTNSEGELVLQLATDYATPVRSQTKNGTTTVSIDITDIYEQYGNQLYVQIDDYAVNSCLYQLDLDGLHSGKLPENGEFALTEGQEHITLDIYGTHKVSLEYAGEADLSNFSWTSDAPQIAGVKNGEIVGLSAGEATVSVSNRKGGVQKIKVTVTDNKKTISDPSISFGVIKTAGEALSKAEGMVEVNAGQTFTLQLLTDPWYHPMTGLTVRWSSYDESIATVDQNGNVQTKKKGMVAIEAKIYRGNVPTMNVATVTLDVVDEFDVSNYTLYDYNGVGYNKDDGVLWIPTDMNIMYIGEDAFKDNDNIKAIVIPASVVQIQEGAFENCSALEAVYFVSTSHRETVVDGKTVVDSSIDWSDCSLIHAGAFKNCKKLKKIDLTNAKTITVAQDCFAGCTALSEIVKMNNIGTMYHRAFKGCISLTEADISGTYVMGDNVFENCTGIETVTTGRFTDIGKEAFKNCTGLREEITLYTPNIGEGAFSGCTNLKGVKFDSPDGVTLEFDIGARAFENCGIDTRNGFTVDFGDEIIRTVGKNAFAGSGITELYINDSFDFDALRLGGLSFNNITVKLAEGYKGSKYAEADGVIYNTDKSKILLVNTYLTDSFEVPASVTEIGAYAFANSKLSTVTFANASALTTMGEGAFYGSAIQAIDLSGVAVQEIPAYAFYLTNLSQIALGDSVAKINEYAFAYSAICEAYLPNVESIGDYAFTSCANIGKVATASEPVSNAITVSDTLTTLGEGVFYGCSSLISADLPSITKMGDYTFAYARNLTEATFGENATATGNYTFAVTGIQSFAFTDKQMIVGEGMFYDCSDLTEVTLSSVAMSLVVINGQETEVFHTVGAYAFSDCEKLNTVNNLDEVVYIGAQAFYNTALTALQLDEAREIGVGAFAVENANGTKEAAYTTLDMWKVEKIGAYAFLNGGETSVEIGPNVTEIGFGAFASSKNLIGFKVADGNGRFVVLDGDDDGYGVLYRYIDKAANTYEIVCYPAARVQEATDGKKVYEIADGTLYVQSAAFLDLNKGALDGVVLPHSVNAIGDDAFFNSGIQEYTFESVQAPVLETSYRQSVADFIESVADEQAAAYYKGYYYSNFETYFYKFTEFGGETSELVMYYPVNGIGYDNYVYKAYFGTRTQTNIVKTDTTRDWINALDSLSVKEIESWADWDNTDEAKKAEVIAIGDTVKALRNTYDLLCKDAGQAAFVKEKETLLTTVEDAVRNAKSNFGVIVKIKETGGVKVNRTTFKTEYLVGETFDMTGMQITLVYEDGTERAAGTENLTVLSAYTSPLKLTNRYVEILYQDAENTYQFRVSISVSEAAEEPETPDVQEPVIPDDSVSEKDGAPWWIWLIVGVGVAGIGAAVVIVLLKGKKKAKTATGETQENVSETAVSDENEAQE
ncbi:MAG: leucine-rich repeat protein [Clostridia bacterium]|nr:leucine-rich repeat protein [Clostridia bacterium]